MNVKSTFEQQKAFSLDLRSEPVDKRRERIQSLKQWIKQNQARFTSAAAADFRKPVVEFEAVEMLHVFSEIRSALKHLDEWVKPRLVDSPVHMFGTRSSIYYEPKGTSLILSPWNYPFALSIGPLVSALAAGNTAVLKPSEFAPTMSSLMKEMASSVFDPRVVSVVEGDDQVAQELLQLPFDHIFFTGSSRVGKVVMKAAAEHLSSVTLELGGKSPAIVTQKARLTEAARRILVSKFVNAGQTCVAPDYVLVQESVANPFLQQCRDLQTLLFDPTRQARIVSDRHFSRLEKLMKQAIDEGAKIEFTGALDRTERIFPPTLISNVSRQSALMKDEIFGPILPVIVYDKIDDAIRMVNELPKPLGLYLFTSSVNERVLVQKRTSSGGMCVNDAAIHFLHPELPFGGVNDSGMGKAHGFSGFLAFSNEKPVLRQRRGTSLASLLYPPYGKRQEQIIRTIFRLLYR